MPENSRNRSRLLAAVISSCLAALLLHAQTPPTTAPTAGQIDDAIHQLADGRFTVRRQASQTLFRAGPEIIPRLRQLAGTSPDPEIRAQASHVLDEYAVGLFPDSPPDVVDDANQYLTADVVDKLVLLNQLSRRGGFGYAAILGLGQFEPNDSPAKSKIVELSRDAGSEITRTAAELLAAHRDAPAEGLLTFTARAGDASCARALAALLDDPRRIDALIAQWQAEGHHDAELAKRQAIPIAMLDRSIGQVDKAARIVEPIDADLAMKLAVEASDWPTVARLAKAATPDARVLGLLASARRLAGDERGFRAAIDRLREEAGDNGTWGPTFEALALNDDLAGALSTAAAAPPALPRAVELLMSAGRYAEARKLIAGATAPADEGELWVKPDPTALAAVGAVLDLETGHTTDATAAVEALAKRVEARPSYADLIALARVETQLCRLDERWQTRRRSHALAALMAAESPEQRDPALRLALPHADGGAAVLWWQWVAELHHDLSPDERLNRVASIAYHEIKAADLAKMAQPLLANHPYEPGDTRGRVPLLAALADAFATAGDAHSAADYADKLITLRELSLNWSTAGRAALQYKLWHRAATDFAHVQDAPADQWLMGWAIARDGRQAEGERVMAEARRRVLSEADAQALATAVRIVDAPADTVRDAYERLLHLSAPASSDFAIASGVLALDAAARDRWADAARDRQLYALLPFYSRATFSLDSVNVILPHLVHCDLARGAVQRGDDAEAVRQARAALAIRPLDSQAIIDLVTWARPLRPKAADAILQAAERSFLDILAQYPDHAMAHNDLAWLYARCGVKLAEAQTHAERAVALQPRNAAYLDTLAEVAYRRGDKAKALELMSRCATLDPHDPVHRARRAAFEADKP